MTPKDQLRILSESRTLGYTQGQWIMLDKPYQIAFDIRWSDSQNALIAGCIDQRNAYYGMMPIYSGGKWAEKIEKQEITKMRF